MIEKGKQRERRAVYGEKGERQIDRERGKRQIDAKKERVR